MSFAVCTTHYSNMAPHCHTLVVECKWWLSQITFESVLVYFFKGHPANYTFNVIMNLWRYSHNNVAVVCLTINLKINYFRGPYIFYFSSFPEISQQRESWLLSVQVVCSHNNSILLRKSSHDFSADTDAVEMLKHKTRNQTGGSIFSLKSTSEFY